jgi:hypothetical protein
MKTSNRKPHSRVSVAKQLRRALMSAQQVTIRRQLLRIQTGKLRFSMVSPRSARASESIARV